MKQNGNAYVLERGGLVFSSCWQNNCTFLRPETPIFLEVFHLRNLRPSAIRGTGILPDINMAEVPENKISINPRLKQKIVLVTYLQTRKYTVKGPSHNICAIRANAD